MLWFERQVVTTLTATLDDHLRAEIEAYVDGALRVMPEHLRAGMAAESLALGIWTRSRRAGSDTRPDTLLERLEASRLDPVRQYVRLLRSLVLFAEHELGPAEHGDQTPATPVHAATAGA